MLPYNTHCLWMREFSHTAAPFALVHTIMDPIQGFVNHVGIKWLPVAICQAPTWYNREQCIMPCHLALVLLCAGCVYGAWQSPGHHCTRKTSSTKTDLKARITWFNKMAHCCVKAFTSDIQPYYSTRMIPLDFISTIQDWSVLYEGILSKGNISRKRERERIYMFLIIIEKEQVNSAKEI